MKLKDYDEQAVSEGIGQGVSAFVTKNPITSLLFVFAVLCLGASAFLAATTPYTPAPTYTIQKALDYYLNDFQLPLVIWFGLFAALWLTKW
jgi:hypothetical protein